jgi:alkylation response protein AidB-like acyl-CoA dehydrogenase
MIARAWRRLSPAQRAIVERAERVTADEIAPRAAEYDAAAVNPVESWHALWRAGLLAAAVPRAYGGLGLDMPTYAALIGTVARGCSSTGMTLHMHSTVMRFIDALGTEAQKRRYFAEVVEGGTLFGSWGSEPAVSQSFTFLVETTIRQSAGGHVIDGVKHFCTMARGAGHSLIWCARDGNPDVARSLQLALVPADRAGLSTDGRWNTLGMRATFSPTVTLAGVHVGDDEVLGPPGAPMRLGVLEGFALGYAAIYLGIAGGALAFAADYVTRRVVRPENVPIAHDPTIQRHVGELVARLEAAQHVLERCAEQWDAADPPLRGVLSSKAKFLATEAALDVTSRVVQLVGGRGAYKDYPAERALRDVRTATLMSPTVDRMMETIGKHVLGLGAGMFNVGR